MSDEQTVFQRSFGILGGQERRTVPLARQSVKPTQDGQRLKVQGYASVFGQPSVTLSSRRGNFTEFIARDAFRNVLARKPDVLLTWDHETRYTLARTTSPYSALELVADSKGLRFFAAVSETSYARDLITLMEDGVVNEASFLFTIAPGGETWEERNGGIVRTIHEVGDLFDVCICAAGAYPQTSSSVMRKAFLDYAVQRRFIHDTPELALAKARARARRSLLSAA